MAKGIIWNGSDHQAQVNLYKDAGGTYTFFDYNSGVPIAKVDKLQVDTIEDEAGTYTFFDYNSGVPIAKVDKIQVDTITNEAGTGAPSATYGISFPAGQGLDFSASEGSGAVSSVLNDYENGNFVLEIADAPTGGNTATFTVVAQEYTKKGDETFINLEATGISTAGMTGGNVLYLRALPYAAIKSSQGNVKLTNITFSGGNVTAQCNSNRIILIESQSGGAVTQITVGDLVSGTAAIAVSITIKS
jgi:hypothetical protein